MGFIVTTLMGTNRAVVRFYNQRGTAEQWIKEGKEATHWTRLSCHRFRANEVRLLLGVIAYNLGNLLRRLVLPVAIQSWSLTSLQQRLFKTGARLIRHARYFTLQLAESYLTGSLFRQILQRIERLVHACRAARSVVSAPREWPVSAMTNAQNGWVGVTMIRPAAREDVDLVIGNPGLKPQPAAEAVASSPTSQPRVADVSSRPIRLGRGDAPGR